MKRTSLPPGIIAVFLLSLAYWLYLAHATRMNISCDAIGYQDLGRLLQNHGLLGYFQTGPNREPIYPLLVAASMHLEHITGLAYVRIMAIFGVLILLLTQALTYKILRLLNIRDGVCALVLAYLALSPALNNTAFSLYSEISALPFILGIVLASYYAWEAIKQNNRQGAMGYSALLGILLAAATLIKAVFECVSPVYLIIFFMTISLTEKSKKITTLLLCLAAAVSFFYVPITGYKWLNKQYNGNFAITNRASWALYGNTARRMQPLTVKRFAEALAYAPGEGVCNSIFGAQECDFWSYRESDQLGHDEEGGLINRHLSHEEINAALIRASAQKALHNPFQYTLLTLVEGLKMFFWESTQIGFVDYPHWLKRIYDIKILNNGLRFLASLVSLMAVVSIWLQAFAPQRNPLGFLIGLLVFLYILFFSFFFILTRYALPIAPLYLISIGIWINQNAKNH